MKKSPKICFSKIKTQKNLRTNFWNGVYTLEAEKKNFLTYKGLFKKSARNPDLRVSKHQIKSIPIEIKLN